MIYCIQGIKGTPVKIGFSANKKTTARRIATLQTGYPYTLRLLFLADGDVSVEQKVHQELSDSRLRGEWFEASPRVCRFIEFAQTIDLDYALERATAMPDRTDDPDAHLLMVAEANVHRIFRGIRSNCIRTLRETGAIAPDKEKASGSRTQKFYYLHTVRRALEEAEEEFRMDWGTHMLWTSEGVDANRPPADSN